MPTEAPLLLGHRYQLHEQLGAGGMGAVYRAFDRLTGRSVALKRVLNPGSQLQSTPTSENDDFRLSIANEFRTLASLRHPHVIAVIDYGFDVERQPYFTMDLLEHPRTLTDTGRDNGVTEKVRLLTEMLAALAYLHRRNVIHRDLKPANVLVDGQGNVKVLDFGLSRGKEVESVLNLPAQAAGTIAYTAPEIFKEEAATPATDLFAVGVMAYELFIGHYPFNNKSLGLLIHTILSAEPDFGDLDEALVTVLARLLAKEPGERYQNAEVVISSLCQAVGLPVPEESAAIRESFLQASQFVGRDVELRHLKEAFQQATIGQGSAWLIGGESGVGKSRLLDEMRIRAAVGGALVLQGQGVAEGGLPYQLWRQPLRRLILSTPTSDLETSLLKEIIPDIDILLQRPVPNAPVMDGQAQMQQLALTIVDLFKRQMHPILLLLEDLQWAVESLAPLKRLSQIVTTLPLLIIGSYRDDERPDLPSELPGLHVMRLGRLSEEAIAALSASILGEAGRQPELVRFLQQETEGNAFFMTEVVRTLAKEAGGLAEVGRVPLPQHVFTGELQRFIQRRLERVPSHAKEPLKLAAVAGRLLDLRVLQRSAALDAACLEDWLTICANSAILEISDGQWRFVHDKLREALLAELTEAERPQLHRRVAKALESEYPDNPQFAVVLADHWYNAGDVDKTVAHTLEAAAQLIRVSAFKDAEVVLQRGVHLVTGADEADALRARMMRMLGDVFTNVGNYEASAFQYGQSLVVAQHIGDASLEAAARASHAAMLEQQGKYAEAAAAAAQSLTVYRQLGDRPGTAHALEILGHVAYGQNDNHAAGAYYAQALQLHEQDGYLWGIAKGQNNLGSVALRLGEMQAAHEYFEKSLALCQQMGNRRGIAIRLHNLGNLAYFDRDPIAARGWFEKSLALCHEIGDRQGIADTSATLGDVALFEGNLADARRYYEQALAFSRELGHLGDTAVNLRNLGWLCAVEHDAPAARDFCAESLAISLEINSLTHILAAVFGFARLYLEQNPLRSAELIGLVEPYVDQDIEVVQFRIKPLLTELQQILSETELADALVRGRQFDLNTVVQELHSGSVIG